MRRMMKLSPSLAIVLGATLACASTPRTVAPTAPADAPADAAVAAAADAPPAPPVPPAPSFSVSETIAEGRGVILAERPGDTVSLRPVAGPELRLADGEAVTFVEERAAVGAGEATAVVEARGVRGSVPNARVVTEARLRRGPDRRVAVFSAVASCGDRCHAEVWLFGPAAGRAQITSDAGPEPVVAWSPDGSRVAIGSGSLHVVTAVDGRAGNVPDVTAPAWAPDGALFARGAGDDDAIFEVAIDAPPRRVYGPPGRRPPPLAGERGPEAVAFEAGGQVLRAVFRRAPREVTARVRRDGTGARVLVPAAAEAEAFVRAEVVACNAERRRVGEDPVFPEGTVVTALGAAGAGAQRVRLERPGVPAVEVVALPRARQIRHPRGANNPLPVGIDFCPPAVWLGPHHD